MKIRVDETGDGIAFELKVKPGAGRAGVTGVRGEALAVEVKSPPEGGKANKEVIRVVAKAMGVEVDRVKITSGRKSRRKRVRISGTDKKGFEKKLKSILPE